MELLGDRNSSQSVKEANFRSMVEILASSKKCLHDANVLLGDPALVNSSQAKCLKCIPIPHPSQKTSALRVWALIAVA